MYNYIIQFLDSIPQYMGEAIVGLVTLVAVGLILGYFTSKYFARINEITRIEGLLFEKKTPIYKEIYSRVEGMNQLHSIRHSKLKHILELVNDAGFPIQEKSSYEIAAIFTDYEKMTSTFLDIDKYIAENRLYFDEEVYLQLLLFQNYIIAFNRFHVIYSEAVADYKIDKDVLHGVERSMFIALGIVLFDDFAQQIDNVLKCLRKSFNNVSLKRRKVPRYDYEFFSDDKGFMVSNLKKTQLLSENEKIMKLITSFVSMTILKSVKDNVAGDVKDGEK